MEQFSALKMLDSVVDAGGFSAAAEVLGVSTSVVSRQIAALEEELGVRLLTRSTRSFALTQKGADYLAQVRGILDELVEANAAVRNPQTTARGRIRVASPSTVGINLIAPAIAAFMAVQPEVTVDLELLDRRVDPAEENFDVVVQLDDIASSEGFLLQIEMGLVASPAYCALHKRPHEPADLISHRGLFMKNQAEWHLRGSSNKLPKRQFGCNRYEALVALCLRGQGIALLPVFLVKAEIANGNLVQILNGFEPIPHALYCIASGKKAAPKIFKDFLIARFKHWMP